VPHHRVHVGDAQRRQQRQLVAHEVEDVHVGGVGVVAGRPAGGAAVAALVGRDDVEARVGQRRHHAAPAVGQLGEAVQQQQHRPRAGVVARFQHLHAQAVDTVHLPLAQARRQGQRRHCQLMAARSFADSGMSFHRPFTPALATVIQVGAYR
jgi:hypothetical protein